MPFQPQWFGALPIVLLNGVSFILPTQLTLRRTMTGVL
jgi:hypothetical protein